MLPTIERHGIHNAAEWSVHQTPIALGTAVRLVVDAALTLYAAAVPVVLLFGGVEFAGIRVTSIAKPLLTLTLVLPIRVAIGGHSALSRRLGEVAARLWHRRVTLPHSVRDGLMAAVLSRLVDLLVSLIGNALIPPARPRPFATPGPWPKVSEVLAVWDSGWYWDIATRGYYYLPDQPSSIAFFPLYPLLTRAVAAPLGGSPATTFWAGIAVSWVAFAAALVMLHRYTQHVTGDVQTARRTVVLLAVFPFSFYFTRLYTESLFLLLTVAAFDMAARRRWLLAATAGALATLTRPNGILIAVPLALLAWTELRRSKTARPAAAVTLIPLAWAGYCLYVYRLAGNPLAWLAAQDQWDYALDRLPYRHLLRTFSAIEERGVYAELFRSVNAPIELLYTATALGFLAAVPFIWKRFGAPAACYVLLSLTIPLSGSKLEGIGRYASVLFPAFMLAAAMWPARVFEAAVIASCVLLSLCAVLFVGWYPLQ